MESTGLTILNSALSALFGGIVSAYFAHRFTRAREAKKRLTDFAALLEQVKSEASGVWTRGNFGREFINKVPNVRAAASQIVDCMPRDQQNRFEASLEAAFGRSEVEANDSGAEQRIYRDIDALVAFAKNQSPKRNQLGMLAVLICFGILLDFGIAGLVTSRFPSRWFVLAEPQSESTVPAENSVGITKPAAISYSESVVFSDVPSLEVKSFSGKAKFLPSRASADGRSRLGYVIGISSEPLNQEKLPEKYKKERVIPMKNGGPLTVLPLKEATYEVYFVFALLDRDEFELMKVDSPKHHLESGGAVQIQGQTEPAVPPDVMAVTKKITMHLAIDKCLSAREE